MAREILPSTSDGLEYTEELTWTKERGEGRTERYSGPTDKLEDLWDDYRRRVTFIDNLAGLSLSTSRGRGSFAITYAKTLAVGTAARDEGVQELLGIDVARPIYLAPYFDGLSPADIILVRMAYEDQADPDPAWGPLSVSLYNHLVRGMDTYLETAYIFRQTFRTNSSQRIQKAAGDANTVQALPALSSALKNQIDALPAGEWLKKPTQTRFLGREGTEVSLEYQWAPKWSVVYGGTFTGA